MPQVTVIEPNRRWLRLPVREIIAYRDLLFIMVSRDFIARYKQTILGPLWFFLSPLVTTLVFTVIFNRVAKLPTDGLPPMLFQMCGLTVWGFFSGCFSSGTAALTGHTALFGKVYFPRLIAPLSKIVSVSINLALQALSFAGFWLYFKFFTAAGASIHVGWTAVLLPLLILQMTALGLGAGLLLSALTIKYRDFGYITGYLSQLWFYVTPVVVPLSMVPQKWHWLARINPMVSVLETCRYALLGRGTVSPASLLASAAAALILLVLGIMVFNRAERTFIDTV